MENNYTTPKLKANKKLKSIFDLFEPIIYALIAVIIIFLFFARLTIVSGNSMVDTLHNGEFVVVSDFMLSYEPEQGDIVVIKGDFDNKAYNIPLVKRVIATEGQDVKIEFFDDTSVVTVDGKEYKAPNEVYIRSFSLYELAIKDNPNYNADTRTYEITVDEGCIFAMGDNRYDSADSRIYEIGCINEKYIVGKAIFRLMPFNKIGGLYND